ncbi:MAG: rRNA maturation RNase YbeY [Desulfamplus sp.]|nr:rRNA maturation RNase YbeY [Desulfamplus sp.]MBF0257626.1 rRNA maturation RNase YbeY [Desulfamplus sp.]
MTNQRILIQIQQKSIKISKEQINHKIRQVLNTLGYTKHEISVVITDNVHIKELNQLYRGIDTPTNVLSFSMLEGEFASVSNLLGDLVISAERAEEEAIESGITLDERMSQLIVHGILHLIGYDHENGEEAAFEMEKKSLELIRLLEPNSDLDFF